MFNPNQPPLGESSEEQEILQRFRDKITGEPSLEFLKKLLKELPELEMYLVGGIVRDTLIKYHTSKDYDFIARGVPVEKLIAVLEKYGHVDLVGRNFGVLKFVPQGSTLREPIDIALPRTETALNTGARRDFDVQSDHHLHVEDDLSRRDLTINAIAYDINKNRLVDPFNGRVDLAHHKIRAVRNPRDRFQEDYSRMLRAIRFACRFNFTFDPATYEAITELMPRINDEQLNKKTGKMERVTPMETIATEILKTLKEDPVRGFAFLKDVGAWRELLPELNTSDDDLDAQLDKLEEPEFREEFPHKHLKPEFILGIIFFYIHRQELKKGATLPNKKNEAITSKLAARFKLTVEDRELYSWLIRAVELVESKAELTLVEQEKLFDNPRTAEFMMLLYVKTASGQPADRELYERIKQLRADFDKLRDPDGKLPKELLNGGEIMAALGNVKAGELIGKLKTALREAQLEGLIESKEDAIAWVKQYKA